MAISVPNAHLLGFWFMLILTGVYISFLPRTFSILRSKWKSGMLRAWLPIAACLFFIVFFLHLGIEMQRVWEAFSVHGTTPGNPGKFYANVATPESLIKNGLTPIVAILSDTILVYRTYVVWESCQWVVVLPMGLLLAGLATAIWSIWTLAQTTTGDVLILAAVTQHVRIFFIITFVLNLVCSGLIGFKMWGISYRMGNQRLQGASTGRVLGIVIESAAIYCAHLFGLIVTSLVGSNAFFVFLDPLPETTVIVFSLLILRVANESRRDTVSRSQYPTISFTRSRNMQSTTTGVEIDLERLAHAGEDSLGTSTTLASGYGEHGAKVRDDKDDGLEL